jgi:periplasmic copper chaperone A
MRKTTLLIASFLSLAAATAHARDYKAGSLDIADPWSRATPKGASVAAGYMKITNTGAAPDRLISGSSDAAPTFEVHERRH